MRYRLDAAASGAAIVGVIVLLIGFSSYRLPRGDTEEAPPKSSAGVCDGWNQVRREVRLYAILENIGTLDDETVDKNCLYRNANALFRWTNRLCNTRSLSLERYTSAFVDKAREMCP